MAKIKQHEIPEGFSRVWRVGGAPWETPYAQRIGRLLGYETDVDGRDVVRLRFEAEDGQCTAEEAVFTPWQLFPVQSAQGGRPGRARQADADRAGHGSTTCSWPGPRSEGAS